ncbi:MAG: PilZ domain-containing protein [Gammaproteobacteria bacterium]
MDKQHFALDRKNERIGTEIPCRLGLPGAKQYDGTITNLSAGGLRLACNLATYDAIIPDDQRTPGQVMDVIVEVKFTLQPVNRDAITLQFSAVVIHTERLAQDSFHIGIQYRDMHKQDTDLLADYIREMIAAGSG